MMSISLHCTSFYLILYFSFGISTNYTSTFIPSETDGAFGSFNMTISEDGFGSYAWNLDLNSFEIPSEIEEGGCTKEFIANNGLKYHIHQSWSESGSSSTSCESCGGHYDPFLACSDRSQSYSTLCPKIDRTVTQGYTYRCNSSTFSNGHLSECEIGDISGKFGVMKSNSLTDLTFIGSHYGDPNPPLNANFLAADKISNIWSSLVIHCPIVNSTSSLANPEILCAQFIPTSNVAKNSDVKTISTSTLGTNIEGTFYSNFDVKGTSGYFQMSIDNAGVGTYSWNFNLSGLSTLTEDDVSAIETMGMKYHIHASWNSSYGSSTTACSIAGGHYDPYLACSDKSQSYHTLCADLLRNSTYGYVYSCNKTVYNTMGHISECEVGDLSGKNGLMKPLTGQGLFFSGSFENDPNPPIKLNYKNSDFISLGWESIVFHLPYSPYQAFYCAQLTPTVTTTQPTKGSSQYVITTTEIATVVIGIIVILGFIVFLVYHHFTKNKDHPNSSSGIKSGQKSEGDVYRPF